MNTDILFQNLSENPAFNTPVAEKTINEIKILDLRYTEEIDIIFMTSPPQPAFSVPWVLWVGTLW